jgi:FMN phosphatase YigB (HAD superfamily)
MIKYIIFDNNGVLTTNDAENTYFQIGKLIGKTKEEVARLFAPHVVVLDKGEISSKEFYSLVLKDAKSSVSVEEFEKVHLGSYLPKQEVQNFALSLKKKYCVILLTNFGDSFWKMFEKWGLNKIFSKKEVFVSSDIHMAKPNEVIFNFVLNKLSAKPTEVVFIDDNSANINSANNLGINAIHFRDLPSLKISLEKHGISIK